MQKLPDAIEKNYIAGNAILERMKAYFLPGLGFDTRIYAKMDLPGIERVNIEWIEPLRGESFAAYAARMAAAIPATEGAVMLVGHSMGGMAAQEIACFREVKQIVLVSSIRSRAELPRYFRILRPLGIHWIFGKRFILWTFPLWGKMHGYVTPEERDLFRSMVQSQSNRYFRWALKTLSDWKAPHVPEQTAIFQIHGTEDKTFPMHLIAGADRQVAGAGHFMVFKQAAKIGGLIKEAWQAMGNQ